MNGDGVIDFKDRTYLGKLTATYYMGLNLNAKYKNFDFSTYMYAELDKEMVRNYERSQPNVNRQRLYLDRWRGEGTSNSTPRVTTGATTNNLFSSFFVEDASFFARSKHTVGLFDSCIGIGECEDEELPRIFFSKQRLYVH